MERPRATRETWSLPTAPTPGSPICLPNCPRGRLVHQMRTDSGWDSDRELDSGTCRWPQQRRRTTPLPSQGSKDSPRPRRQRSAISSAFCDSLHFHHSYNDLNLEVPSFNVSSLPSYQTRAGHRRRTSQYSRSRRSHSAASPSYSSSEISTLVVRVWTFPCYTPEMPRTRCRL